MVSGLNGLTWLAFIALYVRATRHLHVRPLPVQLWDWSLFLLLLAFLGALGLVALVVTGAGSVFLQQAMLHLFLDLFAVGWFILAPLGLLWAWLGRKVTPPHGLPTQSVAFCLAPTFFLGMAPTLVPAPIYWIAVAANLGASLLLGWHLWALWQRRAHLPPLARFGLLALGLHLAIALWLLWPGFWRWSAATQLRVFFLHNLLLGWLSSGLLGLLLLDWASIAPRYGKLITRTWIGSTGLMLLALAGLGFIALIPSLSALFWLRLAAWSSLPLLAVTVLALGATVWPEWKMLAAQAEAMTALGRES
jgi:hypothetical protein